MRLILILVIKIPFLLCQVLCRPFTIISLLYDDHPQRWVLLPPLCGWQDRGLQMEGLAPMYPISNHRAGHEIQGRWLPGLLLTPPHTRPWSPSCSHIPDPSNHLQCSFMSRSFVHGVLLIHKLPVSLAHFWNHLGGSFTPIMSVRSPLGACDAVWLLASHPLSLKSESSSGAVTPTSQQWTERTVLAFLFSSFLEEW